MSNPFQIGDVITWGDKRQLMGKVVQAINLCHTWVYRVRVMKRDGHEGSIKRVNPNMNPILIKSASNPSGGKDYLKQCQSDKQC